MEAEWRPPPRGRNTHSTQTWVEALVEGAKGILAALRVEPKWGKVYGEGERAALEDLEAYGVCG